MGSISWVFTHTLLLGDLITLVGRHTSRFIIKLNRGLLLMICLCEYHRSFTAKARIYVWCSYLWLRNPIWIDLLLTKGIEGVLKDKASSSSCSKVNLGLETIELILRCEDEVLSLSKGLLECNTSILDYGWKEILPESYLEFDTNSFEKRIGILCRVSMTQSSLGLSRVKI